MTWAMRRTNTGDKMMTLLASAPRFRDGQQRVIALRTGVAVVLGALLGQSVGRADRRIKVDGEWCVAGADPSGPGPGQQLAAPVQPADVAPPEAAQEGAQGGWRLDRAAQGADRPSGAKHIGVVNAVAASQRRRTRVIILSPVSARPGARTRSRWLWTSSGRPRRRGQGGRQDQVRNVTR